MIRRKLLWAIKRHPFLYTTRFRLLSENTTVDAIKTLDYNRINPSNDIPEYYHKINNEIFASSNNTMTDIEKINILILWMKKNIKGGPGLSLDSEKVLQFMIEGKGGVCSDLVQIFNNFCIINNIKVREWGLTRIPFDKSYGGHSFNEIYDNIQHKWIMLDVSYGCYFEDNKGNKLSVIEYFKALRNKEEVGFKTFNEDFTIKRKILDFKYCNKNAAPFLIRNYSNKVYDSYLKKYNKWFPTFIIHFLIYLTGRSYRFMFPLNNYKDLF